MKAKLHSVFERLRGSYWFIPSLMALCAFVLCLICLHLDELHRYEALREQGWIYTGGAEGARSVLSAISGSIITVAGTTFSITIAALSLASSQFGPRLLRNFMRDTGNQVVLGTFTSTFLYCILILRTVRGGDDNTWVPHISVTVGVALAVLSVGVLIYFIHHAAESIQISHIISVVGNELDGAVSRLFPERASEGEEEPGLTDEAGEPVCGRRTGYVQAIDEAKLMQIAVGSNSRFELILRPGDYLISGSPLLTSHPALSRSSQEDVRRAFTVGRTRTPNQDAVFAFLQLSEIALRALSPGVNDPFTAVMCIDRISAAVTLLSNRSLPRATQKDEAGEIRIVSKPYNFEQLVEAAYRHIREASSGQWHVRRHLRQRIESVTDIANDPRLRLALRKELANLE